jgi:hypothetical protein
VLFVQSSQKERYFQDGRHKYDEKLNQDNNNQDEMSYILRTHMEKNGNPIYEHGMDAKRENKGTQKYAKNYNQEYDETYTQTEIYFGEQE